MAKYCSLLTIFLITFLAVNNFFTSARDIAPREISLVREPDENYYIFKNSQAFIVCQAKNAADITFTCMGTQIPPTSVEMKDVSDIDPDLIQAEIEVTRADMQNHGQTSFWCECSAIDIDGQVAVTSRKGYVSIAQLKNKFGIQPMPTTAMVGEDVEFACGAPEGQPKPEIVWRKDKKRLEVENNPRLLVTDKGSLVIQSVTLEDKGLYQCVARSVAGRRESEEAQLTVTALEESAEPNLELSEEGDSGMKTSGVGKPRATRQSIKTYFTTEPQEKYYVTQEKPLLIDCGVVAADILTFRCNGKRMDRTRQTINQGLDGDGNRVIQSQLTVTYADVQTFLTEFSDSHIYQCVCVAWFQDSGSPNGWNKVDSNAAFGFVHLAYLDRVFQTEPSDVTAGLSSVATLICEPPKGQPSPWVYWYKDRNRIDPRSSEKYSVNAKGHLTIRDVQYEDAGSYSCLAENSVTSVQSRAGRLTVTAEAVITTKTTPEDAIPTFPSVIPSTPMFLRDFEAQYTLGADGTKTIVCAVVSADQMSIECGGQRLTAEEYELKSEVHRDTGKRLLHAVTVITAEKVASRPDDYFCQCTAWYLNEQNSWRQITSSKGYLKLPAATAFIGEEFEIAPENTEAYYESEAELGCQPPAGNPTPKVSWLKDGVLINTEEDSNFIIVDQGTLIIEYVRVTDEGEYICVAENEAGERRSPAIQFTVIGKPTPQTEVTTAKKVETETTTPEAGETIDTDTSLSKSAISVQHPEDNYVTEEEPATLSCAVSAAKALLFACNGEVLRETATTGVQYVDPVSLQTVRENTLTVTKEMVEAHTRTKSEPYVCHCRAYFQVGPNPKDLNITESSPAFIHIAYLGESFALQPSDTQVTYLQRLELQCQAPSGVPMPQIQWLKNDAVIPVNERVRVESSGTLIIEQFEEDDEGDYICEASNTYFTRQSQSAFVSLTVTADGNGQVTKPKPEEQTAEPEPETTSPDAEKLFSGNPYISKDLHSVYFLVKNKPVTITCEAYSVEFISFTCGMQKVEEQESRLRMEQLSFPDGMSNMIQVVEATINVSKTEVENYEPGKEYWCQCHAHYLVPGIEQYQILNSVKGVVEMAYLKKNFQKEPEDQVVMEGSSLTILCQPPVGNPAPKVTWTKNGENIEALSITPSGVLIIPEVQLDHAGEYLCVAENEAGKRTSPPIQVQVKAKDGSSPVRPEQKCTKLEECKVISSNSLDNSMDRSGVSVRDLCLDASTFLNCVDQNLADCNVTMSSPEEDIRPSLLEVNDWFTQYCTRLILNTESLDSCDEINRCDLNIGHVVADNATYWCSLYSSLVECTSSAISSCGSDELQNVLEDLVSQTNEKYCPDDNTNGGWPGITHKPDVEEEPEVTGDEKLDKSTDGNGDNGDSENKEGGAEASKEDSGNGSAVLGTSIILVTILQLLIVHSLSWR